MKLGGILFSNTEEAGLSRLTVRRTVAAIPFGCRYRLADFPLSAMMRAGVTHISVVSGRNFDSLLEHIGSGKAWDLARHSGGIKIVSPYRYSCGGTYETRLSALESMYPTIEGMPTEYMVLADSHLVYNPDLSDILEAHIRSGAEITLVGAPGGTEADGSLFIRADASGTVTGIRCSRGKSRTEAGETKWKEDRGTLRTAASEAEAKNGNADAERAEQGRDVGEEHLHPAETEAAYLGMMMVRRADLLRLVREARARGCTDLMTDILLRNRCRCRFSLYRYRGRYAAVTDFGEYYRCSMRLLRDAGYRRALLSDPERPVCTGSTPTWPTAYGRNAEVCGSLIAEGCRIEGRVENSLLFRGVTVGRGSEIRDSILFGGCYIGQNSRLSAVCAEKHTVVRDGRQLMGHETLPLFIESGKVI